MTQPTKRWHFEISRASTLLTSLKLPLRYKSRQTSLCRIISRYNSIGKDLNRKCMHECEKADICELDRRCSRTHFYLICEKVLSQTGQKAAHKIYPHQTLQLKLTQVNKEHYRESEKCRREMSCTFYTSKVHLLQVKLKPRWNLKLESCCWRKYQL